MKNCRKLFTKKKRNNKINKKYYSLKVNYKNNLQGGIVYMNIEEKKIIRKLSKKYNKKEKLIANMLKKCIDLNYDLEESKKIIEEFEKSYA